MTATSTIASLSPCVVGSRCRPVRRRGAQAPVEYGEGPRREQASAAAPVAAGTQQAVGKSAYGPEVPCRERQKHLLAGPGERRDVVHLRHPRRRFLVLPLIELHLDPVAVRRAIAARDPDRRDVERLGARELA